MGLTRSCPYGWGHAVCRSKMGKLVQGTIVNIKVVARLVNLYHENIHVFFTMGILKVTGHSEHMQNTSITCTWIQHLHTSQCMHLSKD